jgi:hypothetical protein
LRNALLEFRRLHVAIQAALELLLDTLEQVSLRAQHATPEKNARRRRRQNHGVQQLREAVRHEFPRGIIGRKL